MKKLIILIISQISFGQGITKDIGTFETISVFDRISVELIPSDENKVVISGSREEDVELINKNGNLKIRMKLKKLLDGEEIQAQVYYKKISSIDVSEGSFVTSDVIIKQSFLDINTKEGSEVRLKLDIDDLKLRAVTGAIIKVTGTAQKLNINVGTGGIVDAEKLESLDAMVKITTGGEISVRSSNSVDANIRAGGSITIFGNPEHISKKTTLGGTITESKR